MLIGYPLQRVPLLEQEVASWIELKRPPIPKSDVNPSLDISIFIGSALSPQDGFSSRSISIKH